MNKKLKKVFDEYNKLHWKGKLPVPNLIMTSKLEGFHGCYIYEIFYKKKDYMIKISSNLNMRELRKTMLHEMCHHAIYLKYPKRHFNSKIEKKKRVYPHGKEWIKEMRRVGFKGKINQYT